MPSHQNREQTQTDSGQPSSRSSDEMTRSRARRQSETSIQRASSQTVAAGSVAQSAYPELGSPVDLADLPVDST
ncbi:hypothetical protein C482_08571, partial [Natrialba chahannaoensis JCM 10990]